ncbi:transposase [Burkholderia ubonensis]|uniref:Transposase n=1 Tax=Burkholderia ubonensis subsp. mesacidophila TaxID=265293 RepID=A0A2A4F1U7_9BURK|nr:transposase [Burkholderia ubonensis]PCE26608.1 transposase [Burkholderia ubonensis subsp. mesacidophila]
MTPYRDLTDDEWQRVTSLLPEMQPRTELRGRPLANTRAVLNGVLWVIYSGATWSAMPRRYPSYQTCHRRFKVWHETGTLMHVMRALYGEAGMKLCNTLATRMRKHAQSKAAQARSVARPAPRAYQSEALKRAA